MLNRSERRQFEHDSPVPVFAHATNVVGRTVCTAAHGHERPVAIGRRGVALGNELERKARGSEHLFWSDFTARHGAGSLGPLGKVAPRLDPQELVRGARGLRIVSMHTLHALGKLLHHLLGARVDRLAFAGAERERERNRNG